MPSTEQLRSRLLKKLSELFQLDQPDLDFGFYRIMHAKAQEVQDFIGTDLLKIVADAFGAVDEARKAEAKAKIEKEIDAARDYGVSEPENSPKVKEAQAAYDALKDTASAEADVYDHLYRFFERYYDDGDFISRRYYTRETSGKAAPFAVPYNGEEVKLHWANADQYYIKSAEYFSNFTFDLWQAKEVRALDSGLFETTKDTKSTKKVHFKVVAATEGEHGNVKASEQNKRFFIIHKDKPVELNDAGELVINFEYRPDPEKTGQEKTWRDKRNAEAVETILERLGNMAAAGGEHDKQVVEYLRLLKVPAPTEKDKNRPVLAKYVNQYTARNTMDYFIHKDLGGFLRRELDFYIKNEVMRLDDIENADAPAVESYLAKIKVLRKIAGKLIDFLAQLEDFQKKLWLKKKFIIETNYCITLDRVPEELYPLIVDNFEQIQEWVRLGFIEEKYPQITQNNADLFGGNLRESAPSADNMSVEVLKANNKLVLDTRFFDESFKARLVASIENFDEQCDGLLIHSENFQALNLLQERYKRQIKTVYIDPPYNTSASEIAYKNSYKHSSWLSLVNNSLYSAKCLMRSDNGVICCTIDDFEHKVFSQIIETNFQELSGTVAIRIKPSGRPIPNGFAISHEYAIFAKTNQSYPIARLDHSEEQKARYREQDENGRYFWEMFRKAGSNSNRENRPTMYYPFYFDSVMQSLRIPRMEFDENRQKYVLHEKPNGGEIEIYPVKDDGTDGCWYFGLERALTIVDEFRAVRQDNGEYRIYYRRRPNEGVQPTTLWFDSKYSATEHGTALLKAVFGKQEVFSYPKSIHAVVDCLSVTGIGHYNDCLTLDYFAGSGTTGHAVINLNREDDGKRKYILVEMGDYFDTVLKPRIAKVVYSDTWKDGKPTARHTGISHCFKYIRLESYEDTLNNLSLDNVRAGSVRAGSVRAGLKPARTDADFIQARKELLRSNPTLREDYMLRYLLDVETRGSQSLLNIDAFADPIAYTLEVKKPGTDEYATRAVDLIETFNYLIGLRVVHYAAPQEFTAQFKRIEDPEVPTDQKTKLVLDGKIKQINPQMTQMNADSENSENNQRKSAKSADKVWWFRKVEGWIPTDPANPNNGQREKVLIVWRKLTDDIEQDNLMLDEWFQKNRISTRDFEFDTIYVNGSNNLPNLKRDDENWKVRLIEEAFMKRMWNGEGV